MTGLPDVEKKPLRIRYSRFVTAHEGNGRTKE